MKSDHHVVHTEEVNKIALTSNYDKRLQTVDRVTTIRMEQILLKYAKVR